MKCLSVCDFGPAPSAPEIFNLAAHTLAFSTVTPEKIALTVASGEGQPDQRMSYGRIRSEVLETAGGLAAKGISPGDCVILRIGHSTDFPISFLAACAMGAVPVPTSTTLSAEEVAFIVQDTGAKLVVCSPGFELPGLGASVANPAELSAPPIEDFAKTYANDLAYIVYTSGSSGRPKGVAHAHRAAFARRMIWEGWYGLRSSDVMLHAGAFNWTYTLGAGLMDPWAAGAQSLIYAGPRDPGVWPDLVETYGATLFAATPGVYRQLLKSGHPMGGMKTLRHGLSAGEAMPETVRAQWQKETGKPIYDALGMTECSTFLSSSPTVERRENRAGRPQHGRKIAVLPIEGDEQPLPIGETGIIAIDRNDPGLMLGYWNLPDETESAMRGPWFMTGDLGIMDADGYISYEGRSDDQMNALGYRVAPQEVEAALMRHPHVTGAAAVELPVRADLSVIAAFMTAESQDISEDELRDHCAQHLAAYKIPKIFRVLPELPKNPNGKILRKELRRTHGFQG
ncbi:AMP-dependent synthetase [Loktanella sp. IMCC34160]|uniref:class I adenylate-forming enzyme family protein n=1 Tax=Loktanella sp. IMCC34160 TaxID=2510646 RepID=UPI00101D9971|nr:AMP-binding protein [Loktanella sp. IMCC34160]RYG89940.1 AMP-dependent synthetase [Loktanella sp. IMCC34160]